MRAGIAACLVLALTGCPSAERQEAERVAAALDHMRDSAGGERERMLTELEGMTVEGEQARTARDQCVAAYRAKADVDRALAAAETTEDAVEQGRQLEAASAALKRAEQGYEGCKQAVRALKASIR